jgi:hypothetical protein
MTMRLFALLAAMAGAGLLFGLGYFAALRRAVAFDVVGRRRLLSVALGALRFAAAAIFLFLAARLGALPLLAAFFGFLLARSLALRANAGAR